jgi:hypothetical protein
MANQIAIPNDLSYEKVGDPTGEAFMAKTQVNRLFNMAATSSSRPS